MQMSRGIQMARSRTTLANPPSEQKISQRRFQFLTLAPASMTVRGPRTK